MLVAIATVDLLQFNMTRTVVNFFIMAACIYITAEVYGVEISTEWKSYLSNLLHSK